MKKYTLFGICLLLIVSQVIFAEVKVQDILIKMDDLQKLSEDVTAKVVMVQKDVEQGTKVMECIYFAQDANDLFLIVMTKPESEKGNGYLKSGSNFWMYRRNTRTFQHINRDESIAGTDANAGDFESPQYEKQYQGKKDASGKDIIEKTKLGKIPVYKVEIDAKLPDVDYPKKILWVRQDNFLPLKEQSYSLSGSLMYSQYYLKYTKKKDKFIPIKQLVVDEFEKGNKTLLKLSGIALEPINDDIFTKAYLENLSK